MEGEPLEENDLHRHFIKKLQPESKKYAKGEGDGITVRVMSY